MSTIELRQELDKTLQNIQATNASLDKLRDSFADVKAAQLKTEAAQLKTEAVQRETSIELSKLSRDIRNYIGNDAETVEEYFYQTLKKNQRLGSVYYHDIGRNVRLSDNSPEFDVVLYNKTSVAVVEVKKKARVHKLELMAYNKIKAFKQSFPQFAQHDFYFALATMVTEVS